MPITSRRFCRHFRTTIIRQRSFIRALKIPLIELANFWREILQKDQDVFSVLLLYSFQAEDTKSCRIER